MKCTKENFFLKIHFCFLGGLAAVLPAWQKDIVCKLTFENIKVWKFKSSCLFTIVHTWQWMFSSSDADNFQMEYIVIEYDFQSRKACSYVGMCIHKGRDTFLIKKYEVGKGLPGPVSTGIGALLRKRSFFSILMHFLLLFSQ